MGKAEVLSLLRDGEYVSGEEISRALGVTRAAVWKAVQALRADGCSIDSVPNRGYCLHRPESALSDAAVHALLEGCPWPINVLPTVDSTNTYAKAQAALGAPVEPERPTWDTLAQEDLLELLQTPGWHSAYDARADSTYLVYDGPDNPFDRWFLSVETARSLGQKLDLIRNADLAGIIVWEASLDTKNHSFAAQLRDTLLR